VEIMLGADACLPLICNYLHTLHYLDTLILNRNNISEVSQHRSSFVVREFFKDLKGNKINVSLGEAAQFSRKIIF
jgi:hypothetical protein